MSETEPVWAKYWDELWELLTPLYDAGWAMPEDDTTSSKEGQDKHWTLHQRLMRSCMVFQVTYEQHGKRLTFGPSADESVADEDGIGEYDMFAEPVTIQLGGKTKADRMTEVWDAARRLGLLDPTRVRFPERDLVGWQQFMDIVRWKYLLADIPPSWHLSAYHSADAIHTNPACKAVLAWVDYAGSRVLPDPVPTAAALGIAYWGWRHTVVEDWHAKLEAVTNDVMAKCNILNTKIALAHTTAEQGVDWPAVITALTDPDRTLPDGR